jgi:hypothetical protein
MRTAIAAVAISAMPIAIFAKGIFFGGLKTATASMFIIADLDAALREEFLE